MKKRSLFEKIFGSTPQPQQTTNFQLVNNSTSSFYAWNGNLFDSDIVRSAIRPKANAVGKLNAKHITGLGVNMKINPYASIRRVLEQPNPYMSMQDFLMKMVYQRELTHNAFAYVKRDDAGNPMEIYPVPFASVELVESQGILFAKFRFKTGKTMVVPYDDCIHLRKDFNNNDFFGDDGGIALTNLMDVITTTDQGVVSAIKNSSIIKWIMMFKTALRKEDKDAEIKTFINNYMNIENGGGVAASDPRFELKQVTDTPYIPNAVQMKESVQRLYKYFGVSDNIVQNSYTEDQFNSFYESEIEPITIQLSNAFTKVFFTPTARGYGNKIIFEASNLAYANMTTKLALVAMVDRGSLSPNEWRLIMNLGPIEGGELPLRRLDTISLGEAKPSGDEDNGAKPNE